MSDTGNLIIYPIPSLVATLLNRETAKGSPLREEEVIAIRDAAPAVALTREQAAKVDERRGYLDIDPENCWDAWQRARVELKEAREEGPNKTVENNSGCAPRNPGGPLSS